MQNKLLSLFIAFCVFFIEPGYSQKLVNSPLSRFNLGSMEPAGPFRSIGMGGVGTAIRDNSAIYFSNPASYSSLDTNSFVFDFGLDYGINNTKGKPTPIKVYKILEYAASNGHLNILEWGKNNGYTFNNKTNDIITKNKKINCQIDK